MTYTSLRSLSKAAAVARLPKLHQRLWQIVADDLERLASTAYVADVPSRLAGFTAALRAEETDETSIAIYEGRIEHALDWAAEAGLLSGTLEKVNA